MSAAFRKSGSMVAFTWAGEVQDPRDQAFAGSKSARETFGKLFHESFGVPLQALGALAMALQSVEAPDVEAVEKLEPTRWPQARRTA